jgi:hypothetical protein
MQRLRGLVLHCSRFGCIVRLEDGRFGVLPASEHGIDVVKRAVASGHRPTFPFAIAADDGRHLRLSLCSSAPLGALGSAITEEPAREKFSSSLEQKIIDFWRQASEWDRNAGRVETDDSLHKRTERLLPFEERAPRQYRELPTRPRRGPKSTRRNRS